ncbi:MAG: hypothetical protein R3C10_23950 [Pirellulales bacterium]
MATSLSTALIAGALHESHDAQARAESSARHEAALAQQAEQRLDEARYNLYVAHMRLAMEDTRSGQTNRLQNLLVEHMPSSDQADVRGWEWYYLLSLGHRELLALPGPENYHPRSVAWSPDGKLVAATFGIDFVQIYSAETGERYRELRTVDDDAIDVAWSPDGRRLATACPNGKVVVWDTETWAPQVTIKTGAEVLTRTPLRWSSDSVRIACPGGGDTVGVWNAQTGAQVESLAGHGARVGTIAWSPDNRRMAAADIDHGHITLWDLDTGKPPVRLAGHPYLGIHDLAWSGDAGRLASAGLDATARVWDTASGAEFGSLTQNSEVTSLAWSPNGHQIALAAGTHVTIWNPQTDKRPLRLRHTHNVECVAWSPDGDRLITGEMSNYVRIWEAKRDPEAQRLATDAVTCRVAWSSDDRRLAYGSADQTIKVCDATSGQVMQTLEGHSSHRPVPVWSPDGDYLACGGDDGSIVVWNATTGDKVQAWQHGAAAGPMELDEPRTVAVAWRPGGRELASVSRKDEMVRIWDPLTGKQLASFKAGEPHIIDQMQKWHSGLAWSPDGERLATAGWSGLVEIWDRAGWRQLHKIKANGKHVWALAWSGDGRYLVTGGQPYESTIKIWDTFTGRLAISASGHSGFVWTAVWSPDGRRLATEGQDGVRIWDAATGREVFMLPGEGPDWSHDGKRIAAVLDGEVGVYDASIGYQMSTEKPFIEDCARAVMSRGEDLAARGDYEQVLAEMRRAAELAPDSGPVNASFAWHLLTIKIHCYVILKRRIGMPAAALSLPPRQAGTGWCWALRSTESANTPRPASHCKSSWSWTLIAPTRRTSCFWR